MSSPLQEIERLSGWFRGAAAPLWARAGWDEMKGGFFEALDFAGNPIRGPRRVRVQSRQVYTFSMIGAWGWHDRAESIAADGFDYLVDRACPDEGRRGCVHILDDDGAVIDDRRDLYDQAFLLLACAGRIAAVNCNRARALAEATVGFLDRELASPFGGWIESDKDELPRRQNPHMHLLEAFIALHSATGDSFWRKRADTIVELFARFFFDADLNTLGEFFSEDWTSRDPANGAAVEPGHMMEWVWLLGRYGAISNDVLHGETMLALYAAAKGKAVGADGFLPDAAGPDAVSTDRRLWPQTEYIKAAFSLSSAPDDEYARAGAAIIDASFRTYLDQPVAGLWCDQFDGADAPIAKDVPASILYHLFEAVAETRRYAQRIVQS